MLAEWILDRLCRKRLDVSRTSANRTYLTRWIMRKITERNGCRVFVHRFLRGDVDPYWHDHPWPFVSLILWGGYWELTPKPDGTTRRRWYGPGSVLWRPAEWKHRVELPALRTCWTLVVTGPKCRQWGFWCPEGWRSAAVYDVGLRAGKDGCDAGFT